MCCEPRLGLVECPSCDGFGEVTDYDEREIRCEDCDGTGRIIGECEPIELEDFEEAFGP